MRPMKCVSKRVWGSVLVFLAAVAPWVATQAITFNFSPFGDVEIHGKLNTNFTAGFGVRTQSPKTSLIGKSQLNPNVCAPPYQVCQGLFKDQVYPAQHLVAAPGAPSLNYDQGDLNYPHKGAIFQAPLVVTQDLTLTWNNFGFFGRWYYFYDFVNNNFTEYHPNEITPQNYKSVGRKTNTVDFFGANTYTSLGNQLPPPLGGAGGLFNQIGTGLLNTAQPITVYGPGGVVRNKRVDPAVLRQAGTALQYLDSYIYGQFNVLGRQLSVKVGRQTINWGESTLLAINSINSVNPINANNFQRIGTGVQAQAVFTPINMVSLSFNPLPTLLPNATLEGYYQLEWQPTEAQTPGTFFSTVNVGTNNAYINNNINAGFGGTAQDPSCKGKLGDNPLAGITPTCGTIFRLPDRAPRTSGQYGIHLDYYASNFNNGTDLGLYYEHYNARLPYASFFATYPSCARALGNANHNNATNISQFSTDCPDLPLNRALMQQNPATATSDTIGFDHVRFQLEYPNNIDLYGISFNTTFGNYSVQGEIAYRPNKPFQVDTTDLAFAAMGPSLGACGQPGVNCVGSNGGPGQNANGGTTIYGSSDFTPYPGQTAFKDTFDLVVGAFPGSQRSFPNFVIPYRGGVLGQNTPCYPKPGTTADVQAGMSGFAHPYYPYNDNSPCYIRGWQRFKDFNFDFGATRVMGATENPFGADQLILLYEFGAEWVPTMPAYDQLVLQGPGSYYSPTAGADGSGATNPATRRMACSTSPDCSFGPDGGRFNPHQADPAGFPTKFSWGYRVIAQLHYENFITSSLALTPTIVFSQDVGGTAPGPAGNYIAGRKSIQSLFSFRYQQATSINVGYTWFWGGGQFNLLSDRDFAQFFLRYQF